MFLSHAHVEKIEGCWNIDLQRIIIIIIIIIIMRIYLQRIIIRRLQLLIGLDIII